MSDLEEIEEGQIDPVDPVTTRTGIRTGMALDTVETETVDTVLEVVRAAVRAVVRGTSNKADLDTLAVDRAMDTDATGMILATGLPGMLEDRHQMTGVDDPTLDRDPLCQGMGQPDDVIVSEDVTRDRRAPVPEVDPSLLVEVARDQ